MSFRLHTVDIVTWVALGKQRQTYEHSSKPKLMDSGHASVGSMCPIGGLDPFWEHFGSNIIAQRVDFEGPGLNLGSILHAF